MTTTLDSSKIYESDAIEKHFCVKFEKLQQHAMTEKIAEAFMRCVLIEKSEGRINIPEEEKPHLFKIIEKRLESIFEYTMTDELTLFITMLCETPGKIVMYLWYLQYASKKNGIQHFTCENFTNLFLNGFPCEKDLQQLWGEQKINAKEVHYSDNLLDFTSAGASLFSNK